MWDQPQLDEGSARLKALTEALAAWPIKWRVALVTTTLDGQPEEVFRVGGPSVWPFLSALGIMTIFIGEIFRLHWVALGGLLFLFACIVGWHWPDDPPVSEAELEAFEREHGIPVRVTGSYAVGRWSMWLTIMIVAIGLVTLLFGYFYIRLENAAWPPSGIEPPQLWPALVAVGLLLASAVAVFWAWRRIRAGAPGQMRLWLAVAFVLGLAGLAVQVADVLGFEHSASDHAYASMVYLLNGVMWILLVAGLGMNALTQFWAWRGQFKQPERRHLAVTNATSYWLAIVIAWIIVYGALYLTPYLT
jgi:heme/copper-type cytochrome/quinol oxidase subunit 3